MDLTLTRKKLKLNLVLMEAIFLLFVVGGSVLIYAVFDTPYLNYMRSKVLYEAYDCISDMDLNDLTEMDLEQFEEFRKRHMSIGIADETFAPVYVSIRSGEERYIRVSIQDRLKLYTEEPVLHDDKVKTQGLYLTGILQQDDHPYYVFIKETFGRTYSRTVFTEKFLLALLVVAILIGSIIMWRLSRKIVKPLEQMAVVSGQMADHDFSQKVCEDSAFEETYLLARNFNSMARELESYIHKLEDKNQELLTDNEILQQNQEQIQKLERMRQEFFANISHELKTPLAIISSQVEMIEFLGSHEDKAYYFSSVHDEIEKMTAMIGNLLRISAAEHELEDLEFQRTDFSDLTCMLLERYHLIFDKRGLQIETDIEEKCYVSAEACSLEQAVGNYLSNAVCHTKKGQKIRVSLKRVEGGIRLSVYNDGDQIQEQNLEHIWNDYYQEDKGKSASHVGLGLYIVKKTILLHHGMVGVQNEPEGVCFWMMLPEYEKM